MTPMRTSEKFCFVLMWVFMTLSGLSTVLATASVYSNERTEVYDPTLLVISTLLMLAAAIAYTVLPRGKVIPVVVAFAAAPLVVIAVVNLGKAFPENEDLFREVGLSSWELVYRHYSMLVVPVCLFGSFWNYRLRRRDEKERTNRSYKGIYDLSGDALFRDEETPPVTKKKRSVAVRERKAKQK